METTRVLEPNVFKHLKVRLCSYICPKIDVSRKNKFVVPGVGCLVRRGDKEGDGQRAERFFIVEGDYTYSRWRE
jgi:hypothetical protein